MNHETLFDLKYSDGTHRFLYEKAVEAIASRYATEVINEYNRLSIELENKVATVRIFAGSHAFKPFPKVSCIKLIRQAYGLSLKEAKDVVDHATEAIPELRTGTFIPKDSILP